MTETVPQAFATIGQCDTYAHLRDYVFEYMRHILDDDYATSAEKLARVYDLFDAADAVIDAKGWQL